MKGFRRREPRESRPCQVPAHRQEMVSDVFTSDSMAFKDRGSQYFRISPSPYSLPMIRKDGIWVPAGLLTVLFLRRSVSRAE